MFENDIVLSTRFAYDKPLVAVLQAIGEGGFRSIELVTAWEHVNWKNGQQLAQLKSSVARLGLAIHSLDGAFGADFDFSDREPEDRVQMLSRCHRAADILHDLGGKNLLIRLPGSLRQPLPDGQRLRRILRGIRRVLELCEERGLTLVIETSSSLLQAGESAHLGPLLDRLPSKVALSLDVSAGAAFGVLLESAARYAPRIAQLRVRPPHASSDSLESDHRQLLPDFLLSLRPRAVVVDLPRGTEPVSASSRAAAFASELLSASRQRRPPGTGVFLSP